MERRIAFPGLGLEFNIKNSFELFGLEIYWYGVIIALGICFSFLLFYYLATKKEQIHPDTAYNATLLVVPIAVIGARFTYVVTSWESYRGKGLMEIINIRNGGLAIYGAIIFGLITILIYNKIKKISPLSMLDALAPAVMLGQTIGRWGNFVNAEAYGWSEGVETLPWRMELDNVIVDGVRMGTAAVHPTFLYESLWNFIGLAFILFLLYRKKKFNGEIFFAYMGWYGIGRAFIETLRADSLYIFGTLKFSVVVGIICFISAVIGEIVLYNRHKAEVNELAEYKSAFESVKIALSNEEDALKKEAFGTEAEETEPDEEEIYDEEVLTEQDLLDSSPEETEEGDL